MSDASDTTYSQRNQDDWTGRPLDVDGALDELASRVADNETSLTGKVQYSDFRNNGILVRTGTSDYESRTVVAGAGIAVENGNGVSGNPTIACVRRFAQSWGQTSSSSGTLVLRPAVSNSGSGIDGWYQAVMPIDVCIVEVSVFVEVSSYTSGQMKMEINRRPAAGGGNSVVIDQNMTSMSGTGNYREIFSYTAGVHSWSAGDSVAILLKPSNGSMTIVDPCVIVIFEDEQS